MVEIVIKLPDKTYQMIKDNRYDYGDMNLIIQNGTPLPKGHGRLIIEPTKEEIEKTVGGQSDFAEYGRDCVKAVLDNAETIIEADTEREDKNMANNEFRSVLAVSEAQMPEWTEICKAFAKKQKAKLVFVGNTSCGLEYPDGTHQHVTIQGMVDFLEEEEHKERGPQRE